MFRTEKEIVFETLSETCPGVTLKNYDTYDSPVIHRMIRLCDLKCTYQDIEKDLIVSTLWIHAGDIGYSYATVYLVPGKKEGKLAAKYYALSPCFQSQDGEYRKSFRYIKYLTSKAIQALVENKRVSELEGTVGEMAQDHALHFKSTIPFEDEAFIAFRMFIVYVCAIHVMIPTIDVMYYFRESKVVAKKIDETFGKILNKSEGIPDPELTSLINHALEYSSFDLDIISTCGQKLRPISLLELSEPKNVSLSVWGEIYMTSHGTEMVLSNVCQNFPVMITWMIARGTTRDSYGNFNIKEKYDLSDRAELVVQMLRDIRSKMTTEEKDKLHVSMVDRGIYTTIRLARRYLTLSNISTLMIMENVGTTWATLAGARRANPEIFKYMAGPADKREKVDLFQYLDATFFESYYALKAMHEVLGVVHGDLHANNFTIMPNELAYIHLEMRMKFHKTFFVGDKVYLTEYGHTPYIIDFSRSIMGPKMRPRLEADIGKENAKIFYREQVTRILHNLANFYEDEQWFIDNQERIKGYIFAYPDQMFVISSYTDFVMLSGSWAFGLTMFGRPDLGRLAGKIERFAKDILTTALKAVIAADKTVPEFKFISNDIFEKFFAERDDTKKQQWKKVKLLSAVNFNAPLKYSFRTGGTQPPWVKVVQGLKIPCNVEGFSLYPDVTRHQREVLANEPTDEEPRIKTTSWVE